jgi:hypothetical protein
VALCPCDGDLESRTYAGVIEELLHGINLDPAILLDPLKSRMERYSSEQRFEEAGWLRDRHNALARALQLRQQWASLERAGVFEAVSQTGEHVVVDHGILVTTWRDGRRPLLGAATPGAGERREVAGSVEAAEEAALIWNWLSSSEIRLLAAEGTLALPNAPAMPLRVGKSSR